MTRFLSKLENVVFSPLIFSLFQSWVSRICSFFSPKCQKLTVLKRNSIVLRFLLSRRQCVSSCCISVLLRNKKQIVHAGILSRTGNAIGIVSLWIVVHCLSQLTGGVSVRLGSRRTRRASFFSLRCGVLSDVRRLPCDKTCVRVRVCACVVE